MASPATDFAVAPSSPLPNSSDPGATLARAYLNSMAVRSPELRLAQARLAPGSPELGREEEGATMNSMAGKRPQIHG